MTGTRADAAAICAPLLDVSRPRDHVPIAWLVRATLAALLLLRIGSIYANVGITGVYVNTQDRWLLLLGLLVGGLSMLPIAAPDRRISLTVPMVWALALALCLAAYAGHYALLMGYDLSRDEQMAVFDAQIFAAGKLAYPLPAGWKSDASALNLMFMLPIQHPAAWVSAYLPGNALLRALVGLVADPALTGPLLSAAAVLFMWRAARLLWPGEREPQAVAVLLTALSGQVVMTGMTAYAMPAHLCLNMLWLWLFQQGRARTDAGTLLVGFVATGLHQPLPHPMFVAPFLLLLAWRREWRRLAAFVVVYGAIGVFWLAWPGHVQSLVSGPHSVALAQYGDIRERVIDLLGSNRQPLPLMAANLLRFCTWQAVPMVPLLIAGLFVARRDPVAMALAAGLVLPILLVSLIMAYQGHGFGYRYFHGLIGNAALLAGFGWRSLAAHHERLRPMLWRALILSGLVLLPVEATMAHRFYAPYAAADRRIAASGTDYVVIAADDAPFAQDLVRNRPNLANRPIRLAADGISDPQALAARICQPGVRVGFPDTALTTPIWAYFGIFETVPRNVALSDRFTQAGCRVIRIQ